MPLTIQGEMFMTDLFEEIEGDERKLNSFQKRFMDDQKTRMETYGEKTLFSPKQQNVLRQVGEVYGLEFPEEFSAGG